MKNVSLNKILILFVIVIVLINAVIIGNYLIGRRGGSSASGSSTMLFTQPVRSFVGEVDSVDNNAITVNHSSLDEKGTIVTTHVKVLVEDSVPVSKETSTVPYYFKNIPSPAQPAPMTTSSLSDIQPGDTISVTTAEDLRLANLNNIKATAITVRSPVTTINGNVESVSGNTIIVKGLLPLTTSVTAVNPEAIKQETFTVNTNSNTELAQVGLPDPSGTSPKAERITVSNIKAGSPVVIYFEKSTTSNAVDALLVQVMNTELPRIATSSATPANASPTVSNPLPTSAPGAGN